MIKRTLQFHRFHFLKLKPTFGISTKVRMTHFNISVAVNAADMLIYTEKIIQVLKLFNEMWKQ